MLISDDIKLDYSDVLIRPKRSTLTSRYDVEMTRTHKFVHSGKTWTGVPIMASNMDTVGTPQMHKILSEYDMITCPARHYLKSNVTAFQGKNICMMGGIDDVGDLVINNVKWDFIGIDVANATNAWEWEPEKIEQVLPYLTWVRFTVGAGTPEGYSTVMYKEGTLYFFFYFILDIYTVLVPEIFLLILMKWKKVQI